MDTIKTTAMNTTAMNNTAMNNIAMHITERDMDNLTLQFNAQYATALIPFAVVMALFAVIGILGNIIVILVFSVSREYRNTNFKMFAIVLACIDLLSCITLMPAEIIKTRDYFAFPNTDLCKAKCFFNIFSQSSAALTLFVICIDRFRKVYQPLKKQIWPDLAAKLLIGVMIFSFLISLPAAILCGSLAKTKTIDDVQTNTNITVYFCAAEKKYEKSILRLIYKLGMGALLVIVSIAFIVMYSLIMKTVISHWGGGDDNRSTRFESSRNGESTSQIDVDRKTDEVFPPEELHAIAEHDDDMEKQQETKGLQQSEKAMIDRKVSKDRSSDARKKSLSFNSKSNSLGRKISYISSRSGSDASLRLHSVRRRSSSTAAGQIPYKTLIWFILTIIFIITYLIYTVLSFQTTKQHEKSPGRLLLYVLFTRIYFINNIINPVIYAWLDRRFNTSCRNLITTVKGKIKNLC